MGTLICNTAFDVAPVDRSHILRTLKQEAVGRQKWESQRVRLGTFASVVQRVDSDGSAMEGMIRCDWGQG